MNQFNRFKTMRRFLCLLVIASSVFSSCVPARAQSAAEQTVPSFGKGRLLRADGIKIHFSTIVQADSAFVYKPRGSKEEKSISLGQVVRVEVEKGSYALECGFASGAVFLLLTAIESAAGGTQTSKWGGENGHSNTALVLGFAVGSTALGALIGSTKKKYRVVFPKPYQEGN